MKRGCPDGGSARIREAVGDALVAAPPGPIGIACSGGADSLTLADVAIELAPDRVVVLTIDHGLHDDSARVAERVAAWARGRGVAAHVRRVEVERRASIEAAARDARYAALSGLADELALAEVWLAHTARDQAETVLMRILRGTGPAGLAGMPPRRGRFVRPLLAIEHAAIAAHARDLPVWDDPMNDDPAITRARVRRELLPLLRRENPQLDAALVRLAGATAEWREVIDALAAPHARFPIDCAALAGQPAAIRKRAIAIALGGELDAAHLEAVDRLVTAPARGSVSLDLPDGVTLVRAYDQLAPASPRELVPRVAPPGYTLRPWQPGDRMQPARLHGRSRKLSDLYIDAKIPRADRAAARVIARADGTIVWAELVGIAHTSVLVDGEHELFATWEPT